MDVFTRLASGIYLCRPSRGDHHHHHHRQAPRGRFHIHGIILQDVRDEDLYRKIAHASDRVAEAKATYESLRKRRQALREQVLQLDAQMEAEQREIARLREFRGKCVDEQKARERDQEERRRGRAPWEHVRNVRRSPRHSW
ncbi:hypothetical protein AYL99_05777 [Fonsecaea erecta]|uniref:Uncharacterized protein n=1 Tax=Fonsecaea erecta TaxID=1367422 RepID=A0A178ZP42_9EURO|nr:hypothetical protein AYL99_05777 [Fonsecaea erecta]OAP60775.1 hypothetical protein AYL99_05777 [Fonsecaea erecta]